MTTESTSNTFYIIYLLILDLNKNVVIIMYSYIIKSIDRILIKLFYGNYIYPLLLIIDVKITILIIL